MDEESIHWITDDDLHKVRSSRERPAGWRISNDHLRGFGQGTGTRVFGDVVEFKHESFRFGLQCRILVRDLRLGCRIGILFEYLSCGAGRGVGGVLSLAL